MFSVKDMQENVLHPVEEGGGIPFTSPPTNTTASTTLAMPRSVCATSAKR